MTMHFTALPVEIENKRRQLRLDFNWINKTEHPLKVTDFWIFISIIVFLLYIDRLTDISINRASPRGGGGGGGNSPTEAKYIFF